MNEYIIFASIFTGVLLRTGLPALREWKDNPMFKWSHKYTATAVFTVIISFLATAIGYGGFTAPEGDAMEVFIGGLVYGFGLNSLVNEVVGWTE